MAQATMCAYPQSDNALPQWKILLWCFYDCPCINIPDKETDNWYSETTLSIMFHIFHMIGRCTAHGRIPLKDKKMLHE